MTLKEWEVATPDQRRKWVIATITTDHPIELVVHEIDQAIQRERMKDRKGEQHD